MAVGGGMLVAAVGSYVMMPVPNFIQTCAGITGGTFYGLGGFMIGHTDRPRGFKLCAGTGIATTAVLGSQLSRKLGESPLPKALKRNRWLAFFTGLNALTTIYYSNKALLPRYQTEYTLPNSDE